MFPQMKSPTPDKPRGRIECRCYGTVHKAIGNCLSCGRIHCSEEGPGKCLYCGERLEIIRKNEGYDEAQERMDMLLYFQETQAQRTIVRDMSGEDPLKLDYWIKGKKKSTKKELKKTNKRINHRVQYEDVDPNQFDFVQEDDIGTSEMYQLNEKPKVDLRVEDTDYDDD
ncbi:zinc finger motif, C2HC5-type protein [Entamoeba nuttalli P19]|uniref:Zinc finger motif, C2HC5-type protein n=2 Tax=Entamoeba nuttalli TaxID=412467 RepID=K2GXD8_ENTNP|nr:zinc finger motif, C2HC5-type protein [Entamoeba nuttalli P19]EKE39908.1 zinc finger motif, C2HC5-type protein [Entamoeba nuttalli P19]|eukprot:XP_008857758.1 zinc finger motif, C2HC5-type protein [Entamoeba nuttalli P19]